jgi:hypothetical protein
MAERGTKLDLLVCYLDASNFTSLYTEDYVIYLLLLTLVLPVSMRFKYEYPLVTKC